MTHVRQAPYQIDASTMGPENPLPNFREAAPDRPSKAAAALPPEEQERMGWAAGFRVLPYRMQDNYTRKLTPSGLPSIVIENEHLRATFLPGLGARLVSLVHLPDGRELLERNPVVKFANVALRNAWISGGIEWNLGHFGHHYLTCAPVFAAAITGPDGEPGIRFYEFERCKRLLWQLDVHLPTGLPFLLVSARVVNLNAGEVPMYWWTNIGVPEAPGIRTLVPAPDMLASDKDWKFAITRIPRDPLPDITYPATVGRADEAFFRIPADQRPWIASLDSTGRGFVETSTGRLFGRKTYAWGTDAAGVRWQNNLSRSGAAYYEIQAGLARTQMHSIPMPGHAEWTWTEAFGPLQADPAWTHGADWNSAWRSADTALEQALPRKTLDTWHARLTAGHDQQPGALLATGAGWGALERLRMEREGATIPAGFAFPESSLGPEQAPWLALLRDGALPVADPRTDPGEWMIQGEWEQRLETSLETPAARHWRTWVHLGVMRMERLDSQGARTAWEQSLALTPTAWSLRNLAQLKLREKGFVEAAGLLERAWELRPKDGPAVAALAKELLDSLCSAERYADALRFVATLPDGIRTSGRVLILSARAAVRGNELDAAEAILRGELTDIREGETEPKELWFELHERRTATAEGVPRDEALRARIRREIPLPANLV